MANVGLLGFSNQMQDENNQIGQLLSGLFSTGQPTSPQGGVPNAQPTQAPPQAPMARPITQGTPNYSHPAGNPMEQYAGEFADFEQQFNLPEGTLMHLAGLESSYGTRLHNSGSTAAGPFQFIDSTAARMGLDDISRMDPVRSGYAAAEMAAEGVPVLREVLGREPTIGEIYLAHQQGAGGAKALLSNPDANVVDVLTPLHGEAKAREIVRKNGGSYDMTAGQFATKWINKTPSGKVDSSGRAYASQKNSPQGGDRYDDMLDEIDEDIEDTEMSLEERRKQHRGAVIQAFSKGLGQISQGQSVDIASVLDSYHQRQSEYRARMDELQKQRRAITQRAQERDWTVEDREDDQAAAIELQQIRDAAELDRQTARQIHESAENILNRDLQTELQRGRLSHDRFQFLSNQQWQTATDMLNRDLERELQDNSISADEKQLLMQQQFAAREAVLNRDLDRELQDGSINNQQYMQMKQQQWQTGENLLNRDLDRELQENQITAQEKQLLEQQQWQAEQNVLNRDLDRELQENTIDAEEARQIQAQKHNILMQSNDQDFQERFETMRQEFTTDEREATQAFTTGRDEAAFEHDYNMLNDTQKFQKHMDELDKAFTAGQNQEDRQFTADQADEQRAFEMGMAGDERAFQLGMEGLRHKHTLARDETLEGYRQAATDDERAYQERLTEEKGAALGDAASTLLGEVDPSSQKAISAAIKADPAYGMQLLDTHLERQKAEAEKTATAERNQELATIFAQNGDQDAAKAAAAGDTDMAWNIFKKNNPDMTDDQLEFEYFQKLSPDEKIDWLKMNAASAGTMGAEQEAAMQAIQTKLRTEAEAVAGLNSQLPTVRMIREVLRQNPHLETGAVEAMLMPLKKTAVSLGLADSEDIASEELFQSLSNYLIPRLRVAGSGTTSDFDAQMLRLASPEMSKTPMGNIAMAYALEQSAVRQSAKFDAETEFYRQGGGSVEERDQFIANYMNERNLSGDVFNSIDVSEGPQSLNQAVTNGDIEKNQPFYIKDGSGPEGKFVYFNDNNRLTDENGKRYRTYEDYKNNKPMRKGEM